MGGQGSGFVEQALFEAPPGCLLESTADGEHVIVVDHLGIGRAGYVEHESGVYVSELDPVVQLKRIYWDGDPGDLFEAFVPLPPDGGLIRFSPDRMHVTYVGLENVGTKVRIGVDDTVGPAFSEFSLQAPPTFSPSGGRIAYAAEVEGAWRMVIDHVPRLEFVPVTQPPVFDRAGNRIAFVAGSPPRATRQRVVVNDVAEREYDAIVSWVFDDRATGTAREVSSLAFAPDGRLGYVALSGSSMLVVLDGIEGPQFDEVYRLVFSADGGHVAYAAARGRLTTCLVDGVAQGSYDGVGPLVFSPDGDRLMYGVERGKKFAVVVDGTPEGEFSVPPAGHVFSPDGTRYAYLTIAKRALRGERWCCVVDGVPGPEFDAIESRPVFSFDGDRFAYVARRDDAWFAVVDGSPKPSFVRVFHPTFSTAGHFVYLGFDSRESVSVVVDGRTGPTFERLAGTPSTTAQHRDAVEPTYFAFSPDGTHIAYTGMKRGSGARPVVDDVVGPAYEMVTFPAVDDRRATFYGSRDGYVHRVTYDF
jgi:hypothetical protein